jgi:hypothetical protein
MVSEMERLDRPTVKYVPWSTRRLGPRPSHPARRPPRALAGHLADELGAGMGSP